MAFVRVNLMGKCVSLLVGWLCLVLWCQAQTTPKYSNEFLRIGVGGRAAGLANAQAAVTNDVTAAYWNPAGLLRLERRHELGLMHSEQFAGIIKYDYGGITTSIDENHRIGFTFIRMGVDNIANTLRLIDGGVFNYDRISAFSVADMAFMLTYAGRVKWVQGLNYGLNLKVINRTAGPFATAWGFGFDLGVQYKIRGLQLGLSVYDVTNTFNAWTFNTDALEDGFAQTGNLIPQNSVEITLPSSRLGVGYQFFEDRTFGLLTAFDLQMHYDGPRSVLLNAGRVSFDPVLGLEAHYRKMAFLRAGLRDLQQTPNDVGQKTLSFTPAAGAGFAYTFKENVSLAIDYSFSSPLGMDAGAFTHLVSLRIGFDTFEFK